MVCCPCYHASIVAAVACVDAATVAALAPNVADVAPSDSASAAAPAAAAAAAAAFFFPAAACLLVAPSPLPPR